VSSECEHELRGAGEGFCVLGHGDGCRRKRKGIWSPPFFWFNHALGLHFGGKILIWYPYF